MASCNHQNPFVRVIENVPGIGHLVALFYACAKKKSFAERAALKATVGLVCCPCNLPAEVVDEASRQRSPKIASYALTSRPEWMKRYHGRRLISLCLPGSHQSGTFRMQRKLKPIPLVEGWSQCQVMSIGAQLQGGIRFFDLRVMTDTDNDLWLHHNVVTCVKFRYVLEVVKEFVTDHPSEIVFLYITNDGKRVEWELCRSYLQEYFKDRMIPEQMKDMRIGDIVDQGKNVVISGVPNVGDCWRCIQYRWPNKVWPGEVKADLETTLTEMSMCPPPAFFWYKAECTPDSRMIARMVGGVPGVSFAKCAEEKFDFIEDMAAATNHLVSQVLGTIQRLPFNVLSTDYVQDEIVDRIIELNATKETSSYRMSGDVTQSIDLSADIIDPHKSLISYNPNNTIGSIGPLGNSFERDIPELKVLTVMETNI